MPKKMPSGLKKLIQQKTGRSWYIITRTIDGKRVDPELSTEIYAIIDSWVADKGALAQKINEL